MATWLTGVAITVGLTIWAKLAGFPLIVSLFISLAILTIFIVLLVESINVADRWGWLDRFKVWLVKDQKTPEVRLEYHSDKIDRQWQATAREADAFNLTSDPIRSGGFYAVVKNVPCLNQNETVNLKFSFYENNEPIYDANGRILLGTNLWEMFKSAYLESLVGRQKPIDIVPVTLYYNNGRGTRFRSEHEILVSGDQPEVRHKGVKVGRHGSGLS